jgi:hypothetical protein
MPAKAGARSPGIHALPARPEPRHPRKALLFLKKKKQKNFHLLRALAHPAKRPGTPWRLITPALACLLFAAPAFADGLRPAIARPLQAAERDLTKGDYAGALKKLALAQAVPAKTPQETLTIDQVHAAIDADRQDYAAAAADYATIIATGNLPPGQLHTMAQAEASSDYQAADYPGAIRTITTYLPTDPQFTPILLQSYLKTNNCPALESAVYKPATPTEVGLQMVAYCDANAKNTDGYQKAIASLVQHYPTQGYWTALLDMVQANPDFSGQLSLDFFRLKIAAGVPATEPEYMDMTQLALQTGLPNEAAKIIAAGYATHVLGAGPDADRQTRLKTLVQQRQSAAAAAQTQQIQQATAAQDQPALFDLALNEADGGNPAGLPLMATAIRSGKLTNPTQAELELGIAYLESAQRANAKAMFQAVQPSPAAALAKLWSYLS